jgi:hypothetical protein
MVRHAQALPIAAKVSTAAKRCATSAFLHNNALILQDKFRQHCVAALLQRFVAEPDRVRRR